MILGIRGGLEVHVSWTAPLRRVFREHTSPKRKSASEGPAKRNFPGLRPWLHVSQCDVVRNFQPKHWLTSSQWHPFLPEFRRRPSPGACGLSHFSKRVARALCADSGRQTFGRTPGSGLPTALPIVRPLGLAVGQRLLRRPGVVWWVRLTHG